MEVKVRCDCGQKFKFDVEPVNGRMPYVVNCPVCGKDGTPAANAMLAQGGPAPPAPPLLPVAAPAAAQLQINRPVPVANPIVAASPDAAPPPPAIMARTLTRAKAPGEFNMGLGLLGALLGAGIGAGAMYLFYQFAGFRFPLLGVGIGVLTGYGAKLLYKGTGNVLGIICGAIAMVAVVATLYLMYGEFPIVSIISVVVSVSMAYRIASG